MSIQPIFLLSLPRSGSTLVQRVLSTYPEVATAAEPWVMLPFLTPLEPAMPLAGAWQGSVNDAFRDFLAELPRAEEDYLERLGPFVEGLYAEAAGAGARYFLDKTPPYHWIVDQLFKVFPEAKFVFLWRNPLSVVSSVIETFCDGRWRPDGYRGTLFEAPRNLTASYERHRDRSIGIRYEELIGEGVEPWERLTAYLELDFSPDSLSRFPQVSLNGRHGDPTGAHLYSSVSREPLEKWRGTLRTSVRRLWCERYLRWLGPQLLGTMGYDLDCLLGELREAPNGGPGAARDIGDMTRAMAREAAGMAVLGTRGMSNWGLLRPGAARARA
ncbi:MAG TPA: sulfotransferase [Solirubrobacterales bacterium]|nr:sulfotransferase [Solirubrobacterales bacterium]